MAKLKTYKSDASTKMVIFTSHINMSNYFNFSNEITYDFPNFLFIYLDKVVLTETKTEPIDTKPFIDFDFDHFFTSVTDRMNSFFNDMVSSFRW